uniref:Uncharacterized protein n=1 Tax=Vitis vinifera TaxID=29760 RepID=A5AIN3_VITVI|nr:hypothetical protein VITISV_004762 [Vitis vinifera]
MAGLGRLSGLIINLNPTATTKLNLNFTPSPNFTCPPQSFHLSHRTSPTGNPTTLTSHARLSGSAGEAPEEIDESFFEDEDLIESDEEDETESSADLLIKFLQSMFKKASKHAKKASRSVLPAAISPQLVSFAVDGVLILASLSIIKALLEFLVNTIWSILVYFIIGQEASEIKVRCFAPLEKRTFEYLILCLVVAAPWSEDAHPHPQPYPKGCI